MSTEIQYIVKRPFKYNGIVYSIGEEWEPIGSRMDKSIIETEKLVKIVRLQSKPRRGIRKVINE
jgi:hypothetical protein